MDDANTRVRTSAEGFQIILIVLTSLVAAMEMLTAGQNMGTLYVYRVILCFIP